jgi:hypothetical protein
MAKNLVSSNRNLRMITSGALAGFLHTSEAEGIIVPPEPTGLNYATFTGDTVFDAPVDSGFYQATVPSGSDRTVWISSVSGNDANDGLTRQTPIRTIGRLAQLDRAGYNDVYLFDCLGTYNDAHLGFLRSGGIGKKVLGFYNAIAAGGRRPRFNKTGILYSNFNEGILHNAVFAGLDFYCEARDPASPNFNTALSSGIGFHGDVDGVEFHDNRFMFTEVVIQAKGYSQRSKNIVISRNVFYGSYITTSSYSIDTRPSCLFIKGNDSALLSENFCDYGGWHPDVIDAGANSRNHCWYLAEAIFDEFGNNSGNGNGLHTYSNIMLRGASHGIHQRPAGIQEYNFAARCSVGLQIGYDGKPLPPDWTAIQRYNVVTEGAMQERGINACQPNAACTTAVWGLVAATTNVTPGQFQIHDNIAAGIATGTAFRTASVGITSPPQLGAFSTSTGAIKERNIAWHWNTPTQGDEFGYVDPNRTLASYHAFHGGSGNFDEAAIHFRDRPLGAWNQNCTGRAIGDYVRAGFQIA